MSMHIMNDKSNIRSLIAIMILILPFIQLSSHLIGPYSAHNKIYEKAIPRYPRKAYNHSDQ